VRVLCIPSIPGGLPFIISLRTIYCNQTVRQMGKSKSHFRDGVGSGEKAESDFAIGKRPRQAPGDQECRRAGLGWVGLAECDGRALGPSYRWSPVQLQSHRHVSEPIAALQSGLGSRILLLLAAHLPMRDPGSPFLF
jgi:hypothetical protein